MPLAPDVVDALYRALLGRSADPEGAARWATADSVEQVVAGFAASDEFAVRLRALSSMSSGGGPSTGPDPAQFLAAGGGHLALGVPPVAPTRLLTAFPWSEVTSGRGPIRARVLGPYAIELADELIVRGNVAAATAGLPDPVSREQHDVLVLTDPAYLEALATARPDVIARTRRRLLCPTPVLPAEPHERSAIRNAWRQRLHHAGFVEVAVVIRRRHGGNAQILGVTHSTPDPAVLQSVREDRPDREGQQAWCVADRSTGYTQ